MSFWNDETCQVAVYHRDLLADKVLMAAHRGRLGVVVGAGCLAVMTVMKEVERMQG